jgi:hypothetical protein
MADSAYPAAQEGSSFHFPFWLAWIIGGILVALLSIVALRWVNHRLQMRQAWAMISREREDNKRLFARAAEEFGAQGRQWRANLAALESLQTAGAESATSTPGQTGWTVEAPAYVDSQWQAVRDRGLTALMLSHQLSEIEELYTDLKWLDASRAALVAAVEAARGYAGAHSQRTEAPVSGEMALARAVWTAHCRLGADMRRFHELHTDFLPLPAVEDCETGADALRKSTAR